MMTGADALTSSNQQINVTRDAMHYGPISLAGLGCIAVQGNRNLADFFQVETDPRDGAVVITYNDTSNELIQKVPPIPDGFVDHRGAAVDMVVRQNGGTGLFGTTVTGDPSSGSTLTDGSGDARFDPVYAGPNVAARDLVTLSVANARHGSNDM